MIKIFIPGRPKAQGSKTIFGKGRFVESCKTLKPWRESIRWALNGFDPIPGAVAVHCEFVMPRPASLSKRKPTPFAEKRNGDLDKLARAAGDAITSAGIIEDDCKIVAMPCLKRLAEIGETPGMHLVICPATDELLGAVRMLILLMGDEPCRSK